MVHRAGTERGYDLTLSHSSSVKAFRSLKFENLVHPLSVTVHSQQGCKPDPIVGTNNKKELRSGTCLLYLWSDFRYSYGIGNKYVQPTKQFDSSLDYPRAVGLNSSILYISYMGVPHAAISFTCFRRTDKRIQNEGKK
jgi:hypothetical protein